MHVAFSPDNTQLWTKGYVTKLWDISNQELLRTFTISSSLGGFSLSPDGTKIVVGGFTSIIYHAITGEQLHTFGNDGEASGPVAFSPDGASILTIITLEREMGQRNCGMPRPLSYFELFQVTLKLSHQ